MATTTNNLGLTKASGNENYSVTVVNENLQKIDDKLAKNSGMNRISYSGDNAYVSYQKVGHIVIVTVFYKVSVGAIAAWGSLSLGDLPAGYRPPFTMTTRMVSDRASSEGCMFSIGSGGGCIISGRYSGASDSTDILQASLCYPVTISP